MSNQPVRQFNNEVYQRMEAPGCCWYLRRNIAGSTNVTCIKKCCAKYNPDIREVIDIVMSNLIRIVTQEVMTIGVTRFIKTHLPLSNIRCMGKYYVAGNVVMDLSGLIRYMSGLLHSRHVLVGDYETY